MNGRTLLGLFGGLGALLLILIGWEVLAPDTDDVETPAPAAAHGPAPVAARPAPNGAEIGHWVATILARPLFSVTRKPDATPNAGPSTAEEHQDLPRLSGIFVVSNAKHAIFQPTGDVPPLVVGEGELVAGWNVVKIGLNSVTLKGPNGETTLEPKFDENLVPPPPQAPAYTKPAAARGTPQQPGQPQPATPPNVRGGPTPPNPNPVPRTGPGQPTAAPTRPPFIPQPRTAPQQGGPQQPPGVR